MPDRFVIMAEADLRALISEAVADGVAQAAAIRRPWLTREAMADALGGVPVEEVSRRARRDRDRRHRQGHAIQGEGMKPKRPSRRSPAVMKHADHARLWRAVEGAVADAFQAHPEYLTDAGRHSAVESVTKRAVGAIVHLHKEVRSRTGG